MISMRSRIIVIVVAAILLFLCVVAAIANWMVGPWPGVGLWVLSLAQRKRDQKKRAPAAMNPVATRKRGR